MTALAELIEEYLQHCQVRKELDPKTIRAYRADLRDFRLYTESRNGDFQSKPPGQLEAQVEAVQGVLRYLLRVDQIVVKSAYAGNLPFYGTRRLFIMQGVHIAPHGLLGKEE